MPTALERYHDSLRKIPHSGGGGCHPKLLGVANLGVRAGLSESQIFEDLRSTVHGDRTVPDREIFAAINRAVLDKEKERNSGKTRRSRCVETMAVQSVSPNPLQNLLKDKAIITEDFFLERSVEQIPSDSTQQAQLLLKTLFRPEDLLFLGPRIESGILGENIRRADEWIENLTWAPVPEHIIPNPVTGLTGQTKDGKASLRCDAATRSGYYLVVEFDTVPLEQQLTFFAYSRLPIAALIFSGSKSYHAWIDVRQNGKPWLTSPTEWELTAERLKPMLAAFGVDRATFHLSRLSRMPGHYREEKNALQRVVFLDPFPIVAPEAESL